MKFNKKTDRIWLEDENGKEIAYVEFPKLEEGVVSITHTVVDTSLRGQGIAGKLLEELVKELAASGRKAKPVCSYAISWFEKHPEHEDLIQK
ncbi:MAG: GNAT family N-acetyltransferase [Johnsonella sp.]|nr:GNAT family N-acetyltransferase [Johnsonella sp.]